MFSNQRSSGWDPSFPTRPQKKTAQDSLIPGAQRGRINGVQNKVRDLSLIKKNTLVRL